MSDLDEKLNQPHESAGRARRTWPQLQTDGSGIDVLETDASGVATRIRRKSMECTTWVRVGGHGAKSEWELEGKA
jgi:hypothetical protein